MPQGCFQMEATTTYDFVKELHEAVQSINSWASAHTNGPIESIVTAEQLKREEDESRVSVILANALYFKGFWLDKFNPLFTQKRDFYLLNGDTISDVPCMTSWKNYGYGSFDDYKVLEIPYQRRQGKRFCMQLVLPHEKDGLQNLLEKLNSNNSDGTDLDFKLEYTSLDTLWIPKFKFSCSIDNEDIKLPFMEEGKRPLQLAEMLQNVEGRDFRSKVYQKAFIEVDEEGTEAAAVTYVIDDCVECEAPDDEPVPLKTFVADHPFLFIIKEDRSGLVFFVGAVLNPLKEN